MTKSYIFEVEYGGLGDHLFYSPLPRLLKELGIADKVYLSKKSKVRNPQTVDFVWNTNPFLDGLTEELPTEFQRKKPTLNKVINLELAKHGIVIDSEVYPELYSTPIRDQRISEQKFLDLNYISFVGAITPLDEIALVLNKPDLTAINPKGYLQPFLRNKPIFTKSLLEYAQFIFNAKEFHCLTSGGATLSAALKKPATAYYGFGQNSIHHHSSNTNIQIGGDNYIRKEIAKFLQKKNILRERTKKNEG